MSAARATVHLRSSDASARPPATGAASLDRGRVVGPLSPAAAASASAPSASFVGASSSLSSSARLVAAALQADPDIFKYDEAVEPATRHRSRTAPGWMGGTAQAASDSGPPTAATAVRPASRYIGSLVRAAGEREAHRAVVQQLARQKEIEREELMDEFKGKERFVTAAYKHSLTAPLLHQPNPHLTTQQQRHGYTQPQAEAETETGRDQPRVEPAPDGLSSGRASAGPDGGSDALAALSASDEPQQKRRRTNSSTAEEAAVDGSGGGCGGCEGVRACKRAAARDRFLARQTAVAVSRAHGSG